jgi:hypothetical protein
MSAERFYREKCGLGMDAGQFGIARFFFEISAND